MSDKINRIQEKSQTFALIGRRLTPSVMRSLATVAEFLKSRGHNSVYDEETAKNAENQDNLTIMSLEKIAEVAVAAIVLGGDGTMLGIGRSLAPYDVPIIGVNHGRLGFMADISLDIMIPVLSDILDGQFISEKRTLLEGRVFREEQEIHSAIAFNEVVISRGAGSGLIELSVSVNERFMYSQRSDGLIVATPTGSTAYALSVGGPVLHPNLNGIVLASIAPHSLSNRPIVLPDSSEIVVQIVDARFPTVNFDSHSFASVHNNDRVIIRRSRCEATFIHPRNWSYYNTLRDKLGWNNRVHHNSY